MMTTLSEIQQWKPDDMYSTAGHFNDLADRREDTMASIKAADTGVWIGKGGEGKDTTIAGHAATATVHAGALRAAAVAATTGGQTLYGMQQGILKTVDTATSSGWKVGDNFQVTDTATDPWSRAARQGIGAAMQADLATQVGAFEQQRVVTANAITGGIAPLGNVQCRDYGYGSGNWTCWEELLDGSLFTWQSGGDLTGAWPDAFTTTGAAPNHVQTVDYATGKGHMDHGQCDNPEWQDHMNRSLLSQVISGAAMGGIASIPFEGIPAIPMMSVGGALGGVRWFLNEIESDGPSCQ
jgi:hypothetical protein